MALDADDLKTISETIAAALKADREESDKAGKTRLAKLAKEFDEKLAKSKPAAGKVEDPDAEDPDEVDDQPAKRQRAAPAVDKKTQARIDKLERETAEAKAARDASDARANEQTILGATATALLKAGIPAEKHRNAIALLHHTDKRLRMTEDGAPGVFFQRKGYDEVLPMDEGLAEWLKTDDGKSVTPAKGGSGTGTGAGNRAAGSGGGHETSIDTVMGGLIADLFS